MAVSRVTAPSEAPRAIPKTLVPEPPSPLVPVVVAEAEEDTVEDVTVSEPLSTV